MGGGKAFQAAAMAALQSQQQQRLESEEKYVLRSTVMRSTVFCCLKYFAALCILLPCRHVMCELCCLAERGQHGWTVVSRIN
jgi:hypothetical protein